MSYQYQHEKQGLFKEEEHKAFLVARDRFLKLIGTTGAARAGKFLHCWPNGGNSWTMMAGLDYMVECGDVRYVPGATNRAWQDQIVEGVRC